MRYAADLFPLGVPSIQLGQNQSYYRLFFDKNINPRVPPDHPGGLLAIEFDSAGVGKEPIPDQEESDIHDFDLEIENSMATPKASYGAEELVAAKREVS